MTTRALDQAGSAADGEARLRALVGQFQTDYPSAAACLAEDLPAGALTGVILLGLVQNVSQLAQIQICWNEAVAGAIILVALGLARVVGSDRF